MYMYMYVQVYTYSEDLTNTRSWRLGCVCWYSSVDINIFFQRVLILMIVFCLFYYTNTFNKQSGLVIAAPLPQVTSNHYKLIVGYLCTNFTWHWPRCIKFAFERKSEKSNTNWLLTKGLRLIFLICVQTQIYATGPLSVKLNIMSNTLQSLSLCNPICTMYMYVSLDIFKGELTP